MHRIGYMFCKVIPLLWIIGFMSCQSSSPKEKVRVFHYNQHNNITSLDPAFAKSQNNIWAVNHLYTTLVQLDDSLSIVPALAKSWTLSQDGLTYTFWLKDNVFFHESPCFGEKKTRQVKASDVVYSYQRLLDPVLNAPGSWIFTNKVIDNEPFRAINDTTFTLVLKKPFSPFLSLLSMQYCSIVPYEAVDYFEEDFFKNPVGSGPFQFKTWIENQGLFLTRNPLFFEWQDHSSNSNIDGVRTSFMNERSIAFLELINGRLDFFSGLESGYVNTALTPSGQIHDRYQTVSFIKSPYLNFEYLGINPNAGGHPLLGNKAFRQALNYGIDRTVMLKTLRNDVGKPADAGVITRGLPSYDPEIVKGYHYDPQQSKELLSQFSQALLNEELVIHTSKDYLDLTTYIAKQWENLGLTIRIEVMESAALRDAMRKGEIPLFRASWIADYPDGESFLSMFYSQNPAPPNYTRFQNQEFDRLYELALSSTLADEKMDLYQTMDQLLIEESPVIFLFYDEIALFVDKNVKGLSKNALNLLQVKNIVMN